MPRNTLPLVAVSREEKLAPSFPIQIQLCMCDGSPVGESRALSIREARYLVADLLEEIAQAERDQREELPCHCCPSI